MHDRRRFLLTSLSGVLVWPLAAEAQSPTARIGLLGPDEEPRFSEIASGLKEGLREQGYREDTIHVVEGRTQRGDEAGARATVQALAGNVLRYSSQSGPRWCRWRGKPSRNSLSSSSRPVIQWRRGWSRAWLDRAGI